MQPSSLRASAGAVAPPIPAQGTPGSVAPAETPPRSPEKTGELGPVDLMEKAFTQADYAINITDAAGVLVQVNQAYLDLYGFQDASEVLGKTQRIIKSPHTSDWVYRELWKTISSGKTWRGNLTNIAKNGSEVFVHLSISPLFDQGRIVGYMGFALDRAQQVMLERQLYHANKLMILGTLGAGLAHELNNPLASILLDAEYLQDVLEDPSAPLDRKMASSAARSMITGVARMKKVLEHLLLYARKEIQPAHSSLPLRQLAQESLLFMEKQLANRGIEVSIEIESDLFIACNRTQLESVIHNLLTNSSDAFTGRPADNRRIRMTGRCEGPCAVLEYRDNAGGIPEDIRDKIFEPFFTTKQEKEGCGLGLAISRKIVLEHGGQMECESGGEETLFRLRFPLLGEADCLPRTSSRT